MGEIFQFTCPGCGYSVEVSGGDDAGMTVVTTTVVCEECRCLHDVVTADLMPGGTFKQRALRCPKSAKHNVRRWESGDACPKCGQALAEGESVCLWD